MWGIVWDKVNGEKWWLDKDDKNWWVEKPYFPYTSLEAAKYEASPFVDIRIVEEKDWNIQNKQLTNVKTENDSLISSFATCTAPNCCAKCSAPIPCKYHS